ncbi:hypothetical protein TWF718_003871 [Orbilia javanica]|uniref:Uncharacterized protein n=1 Tax=Orbilia javanica TaxID=47235 RepID=A0AAN8NAI4_9PEZI
MHSKLLSGIAFFASIGHLTSALVIQTAMVDRWALISTSFPSPVEKRGVSFCEPIQKIVNVLKIQKARAFCNSYLNIQAKSIQTTQMVQAYTTTTATVEDTLTTTVTAATEVLTLDEKEVVATLPTAVATEIIITDSTTTIFSTPPAATVTTTVYTTAVAAKQAIEVDKWAPQLPLFIADFAPTIVSKACACLELPTPTVTVTTTSTNSNLIQTQITKNITNTKYVTLTVTATETTKFTTYTPITSTVTSANIVTTTSVLPEPTVTITKTMAFRPQCTSLLAQSRLVKSFLTPGRRPAYRPSSAPVLPGDGDSEYTHSLCCEMAYETKDVLFATVLSENGGPWVCRLYYSFDIAPSGVSERCPKGRPSGDSVGLRVGTYEPFGSNIIGPCLGYDGPL